jgi:hypothetical protein
MRTSKVADAMRSRAAVLANLRDHPEQYTARSTMPNERFKALKGNTMRSILGLVATVIVVVIVLRFMGVI